MAGQPVEPINFKLSKPLPEPRAKQAVDIAAIINGLMVLITLLPVLPFLFFIFVVPQFDRGAMNSTAFGDVIFLLTLLSSIGATCFLPILIPAGWVLSQRRKTRTGQSYRWWSYLLAAILWMVYTVFSVLNVMLVMGFR